MFSSRFVNRYGETLEFTYDRERAVGVFTHTDAPGRTYEMRGMADGPNVVLNPAKQAWLVGCWVTVEVITMEAPDAL